jgi:N-acetylglutamate synthase-like GNAT family acetyltransferase
MPSVLNAEVSVAFSDEELDDHVLEQRDALKALYLSSKESESLLSDLNQGTDFMVEENISSVVDEKEQINKHFIVKRGLQVVGVATYSETTGHVFDVAVRPSAGKDGVEALFNAVKDHSKKIGRSGSLLVFPRTEESKQLFEAVGFGEVDGNESEQMEFIHE